MTETKKKSSGLRSAVRYGEITKAEALAKVEEWKSKGQYVNPELISWLNQRKQKKVEA